MRIRDGIVVVAVTLLAIGCGSTAAGGGPTTLTADNTLEITGDLSEVILLDATSCPDELMGHVSGAASRKVDLSFRGGTATYIDDSGTTWTGPATVSQKSDGTMEFTIDLTSSGGKTIHVSGKTDCK